MLIHFAVQAIEINQDIPRFFHASGRLACSKGAAVKGCER